MYQDKEEVDMSVFSEYLTVIKNKRNLNSADVAKICGLDTTVVFRWIKGERIPDDIGKLKIVELRLRLSEQEINNLEDAYMITVYGDDRYKDFKFVCKIISEIRRYTREGKYIKMSGEEKFIIHHEMTQGVEVDLLEERSILEYIKNLNSNHNEKLEEFKVLHGKYDIIEEIGKCFAIFRKKRRKKIYVTSSSVKKEVNTLLGICCNGTGISIERIFYMQTELMSYSKNKKLELLKEVTDIIFQKNKINIYLVKTDSLRDMNWIIAEDFFIQYNNDITEGIITTYPEWINMQKQVFECIRSKSDIVGKNEIGSNMDIPQDYSKNTLIKVLEYQPCLYGSFKEIGVEEVKTFFTEKGLYEFMNTGRLDTFNSRFNKPFSVKERCDLLRECVRLSKEGKNKHYLIKYNKLCDIKNIHIKLNISSKDSSVVLDVNNSNEEREGLLLHEEAILDGFKNFFDCLENEKYVYNKGETEEIMMRIVKEYETKEECECV